MYSRYPVRYVRTNDQCPDNIEAVRQQREREIVFKLKQTCEEYAYSFPC